MYVYSKLDNKNFPIYVERLINAVKDPNSNISEILSYDTMIEAYFYKHNVNFIEFTQFLFKDFDQKDLYYNYISNPDIVIEKDK